MEIEELTEFDVVFEIREKVTYTVNAADEDEAIRLALSDVKLDYSDAEFYDVYKTN